MARIFVPAGFEASEVSPDLYLFLHNELEKDLYVLLEFHSGGRNRRQVDVAVLGPYGVDIVEVKAKVRGAVIASNNGPWHIRRDDGVTEELPLNGSARENPYDQADHTAADFKRWLESELGVYTRVFPVVLVPQYRRDNNVRNRGFVWAANRLENFQRSLRSLRPYKDVPPSLSPNHWERIVNALALSELKGLGDASPTPEGTEEAVGTTGLTTGRRTTELQSNPVPVETAAAPSPMRPSPPLVLSSTVPPGQSVSGRRSPWLAALLGGVVAALLLGFGWFVLSPDAPTTPAAVPVTEPSASDPVAEAAPSTETEGTAETLPGVAYERGEGAENVQGDRVASPGGSSCRPRIRSRGTSTTRVSSSFTLKVSSITR